MKILFTGGSSFTGMWFINELSEQGHKVTATLLSNKKEYQGIRKKRVEKLKTRTLLEKCSFGSDSFLQLIKENNFDLLCHHAADVVDYKSPKFNYTRAVANNTHNLEKVLLALKKNGCKKILLTGSVFEQREGVGSKRAVSPYGLSKGLTSDVFDYFTEIHNFKLGKFVIPNPFGPYEEERFTAFLMKTWLSEKTASVTHPDYIRDNIPVSLLAKAYVNFATHLSDTPGKEKLNPSYYRGSQGSFTKRLATAMQPRLNKPCTFTLLPQQDQKEPLERVNTETLDPAKLNWDEEKAWDDFANYYST